MAADNGGSQPTLMVPPHSAEAEQAVLGGIMLDNNVWPDVAAIVTSLDFHYGQNRVVYEAMETLASRGDPLDPITVADALKVVGTLDKAGGIAYLEELLENTPGAANSAAYAGIVADRAALRRAANFGSEIIHKASAPGAKPHDLLAFIERGVSRNRDRLPTDDVAILYRDLPMDADPEWLIEDLIDSDGVYLFIGEPKSGKTTALRTLATAVATGKGKFLGRTTLQGPVAYVDFENSPRRARKKWRNLLGNNKKTPLWLVLGAGTHGNPMRTIETAARQAEGIALLIVDGLKALLPHGGESHDGGYTAMGGVIEQLRALAARHGCAIVVQHHVGWGEGADKRPLGSVALAGQVDGILVFEKTEDGKYYKVESNFMREGDLKSTTLTLNEHGAVQIPRKTRDTDEHYVL